MISINYLFTIYARQYIAHFDLFVSVPQSVPPNIKHIAYIVSLTSYRRLFIFPFFFFKCVNFMLLKLSVTTSNKVQKILNICMILTLFEFWIGSTVLRVLFSQYIYHHCQTSQCTKYLSKFTHLVAYQVSFLFLCSFKLYSYLHSHIVSSSGMVFSIIILK